MNKKEPDDFVVSINSILEVITKFSSGNFSARSDIIVGNEDLNAIITGLNMLGEELQASVISYDLLNKILSTLTEAVIAVDSGYEIIWINQAALLSLGYTERELLGTPSRRLFSENVFDNYRKYSNTDQKIIFKEETIFYTFTGGRILFELSIIPFEWKSENKSGYLCVGYNIQEKNEILNTLHLHDKVVRNMVEGICLISETTGKVFYTNKRLDEMFGYNPGELVASDKELPPFPAFFNKDAGVDIAYSVATAGSWTGEVSYFKKDGTEIWCNTSVTTFEHAGFGTVWLVMHTDISQLKYMQLKLKEISLNDSLTGLRNRRALDEKLAEEWSRGFRGNYSIGLIILDVDFYKSYNDHFGHLAGDSVLLAVSGILGKAAKRAGDVAARFGGDEFVLILPMTGLEETRALAEFIRQEIEKTKIHHPVSPFEIVTVSCGISSLVPGNEMADNDLLKHADKALYKAKAGGKNKVESL